MKFAVLLVIIVLISQSGYAQNKYRGQVIDDGNNLPLPGVTVADLTSHIKAVSGDDGKFMINAKIGDILTFNLQLYQGDTILITNLSELKISIAQNNKTLREVKIRSTKINVASIAYPPTISPFNSKEVLYQTDGAGNYVGGVKFMLNESKNYRGNKTKQQKLNLEEQQQNEITAVFCADTLKKFLPIQGQEMENFIILYRPEIKVFYGSGFALPIYLSNCYKAFNKIPVEKRRSKDFLKISQ